MADESGYLVFGREFAPTTGTRHLQGYFRFKNARTMDGIKSLLGVEFGGIHLEAAKGSARQNRQYCTKDDDFEEFGLLPSQGRRTDLLNIQAKINEGVSDREIAREHFTQWVIYRRSFAAYRDLVSESDVRIAPSVYVLWGDPGCGKTRFVYEFAGSRGQELFRVPDPGLRWFDGYEGQPLALIDDYRGGSDYSFLLQVLDRYPLRVPVKGGFVSWRPRYIFVTSNNSPDSWHIDEDYAPLRRRFERVVRVRGEEVQNWDARYDELKIQLNIE